MDQAKGRFYLPEKKMYSLQHTFLLFARDRFIDVEVLRCALGIYMFGAQLRRELM